MSVTILAIGLIIFFAHFLSLQFRRTQIPDVLVLMLAGILMGPVLGLVEPSDFGKIGSVIATIALVVILFESGTSLDLNVLGRSAAVTGALTLASFVLSALIVSVVGVQLLGLEWVPAAMLGTILGGTASAVVIPMVSALGLSEKTSTVLVLESALTDVLCILGAFALLQAYGQGGLEAGRLIGSVLSALIFAIVIGVLGGIGWMLVLGKIRDFPNTISSTLAYVFIVYGGTELLGFSGAIAALALGVTLTNTEHFGLARVKALSNTPIIPLNEIDLVFYREAVFLLKTYFFVYLGISVRFGSMELVYAAAIMVLAIFAMRIALTRRICRSPNFSLRDTAIITMMAPKGLAAAVLAGLPLQFGVPGAELIRDTTYIVVLVSIVACSLLVWSYPLTPLQRAYAVLLGKPVDR